MVDSEHLHLAILSNSSYYVKIALEDGGACPNKEYEFMIERTLSGSNVTIKERDGENAPYISPLATAIINANKQHCCDNNHRDQHTANRFPNAEAIKIIKILLEKGAKIDSTVCSGISIMFGNLLIYLDSGHTASELLKELIQLGCGQNNDDVVKINREILEILEQHRERLSKNSTPEEEPTVPVRESTVGIWKSALQDPKFADITFVCPDGKMSAHKAILATACPYFETAFSGEWKEVTTGEWKTDKPLVLIKAVVEFIYTGIIPESVVKDHTLEMMELAAEYQVEALKRICVAMLGHQLSLSNFYDVMLLAHVHDLVDLKAKCFEFMRKHSTAVLAEPSLMQLPFDHPDLWKEFCSDNKQSSGAVNGA